MEIKDKVFGAMIDFDKGDARRIQHFTKVYSYAHLIGAAEGLSPLKQEILDLAALVHDIGIIPAEKKYGYSNGRLQEEMGPSYAKELLLKAGVDTAMIERIAFLVGHHHTYDGVDGLDWQILLEADFLVNAYEKSLPKETIAKGAEKFFKTKSGIQICRTMFDL